MSDLLTIGYEGCTIADVLAELRAARVDVAIGMLFSQLVMYCIILVSGTVLHTPGHTPGSISLRIGRAVEPVAARGARRGLQQTLPFVETDRIDVHLGGLGEAADGELAGL